MKQMKRKRQDNPLFLFLRRERPSRQETNLTQYPAYSVAFRVIRVKRTSRVKTPFIAGMSGCTDDPARVCSGRARGAPPVRGKGRAHPQLVSTATILLSA